jgi:hypothetical protein
MPLLTYSCLRYFCQYYLYISSSYVMIQTVYTDCNVMSMLYMGRYKIGLDYQVRPDSDYVSLGWRSK